MGSSQFCDFMLRPARPASLQATFRAGTQGREVPSSAPESMGSLNCLPFTSSSVHHILEIGIKLSSLGMGVRCGRLCAENQSLCQCRVQRTVLAGEYRGTPALGEPTG